MFVVPRCYSEVLHHIRSRMDRGDGLVLKVLQTGGLMSYMYAQDSGRDVHLTRVSTDQRRPLKAGPDGLGRFDDTQLLGQDWDKIREHIKLTMRNAHGNIGFFLPQQKRVEEWLSVNRVTFGEVEDEHVPQKMAVKGLADLEKTQTPKNPKAPRKAPNNNPDGDWVYMALVLFSLAALGWYFSRE